MQDVSNYQSSLPCSQRNTKMLQLINFSLSGFWRCDRLFENWWHLIVKFITVLLSVVVTYFQSETSLDCRHVSLKQRNVRLAHVKWFGIILEKYSEQNVLLQTCMCINGAFTYYRHLQSSTHPYYTMILMKGL